MMEREMKFKIEYIKEGDKYEITGKLTEADIEITMRSEDKWVMEDDVLKLDLRELNKVKRHSKIILTGEGAPTVSMKGGKG